MGFWVWDLCFGIIGLEFLVWDLWFGNFRLGSVAWVFSAWNLRIGIYGLGSLICIPRLGEPAGLDGGTGAPVNICLVNNPLGKNPSS